MEEIARNVYFERVYEPDMERMVEALKIVLRSGKKSDIDERQGEKIASGE